VQPSADAWRLAQAAQVSLDGQRRPVGSGLTGGTDPRPGGLGAQYYRLQGAFPGINLGAVDVLAGRHLPRLHVQTV